MTEEKRVIRETWSSLPTNYGEFRLVMFSTTKGSLLPVLVKGFPEGKKAKDVLVRLHSECFTGETLLSQRCDCREQLSEAMKRMEQAQEGVIIYLFQEGRGIGLLNKIRAYNLQDKGVDTVEANEMLGFRPDEREYSLAAAILKDLGIESVKLLTNNPDKVAQLEKHGVVVSERVPVEISPNTHNAEYLSTKKEKFKHLL